MFVFKANTETRRRTRRRGFMLAEAVVSSMLIGLVLLAALKTLDVALKNQTSLLRLRQRADVGRRLMNEILQQNYADPNQTPVWGVESSEGSGSRVNWDDVDDYDGWNKSPPQYQSGSNITDLAGFTENVLVQWVDPSSLAVAGANSGAKKITVTVTDSSGNQTVLVGVRMAGGIGEQKPPQTSTFVTWAGVEIKASSSNSTLRSGVSMTNGAQ